MQEDSIAWTQVQHWLQGSGHVLILSGGAGTGKTTLIKKVVEWARAHELAVALLAPTGRAARILSRRTGAEARTIHSVIFGAGSVEVIGEDEEEAPDITYCFPLRGDGPGAALIVVDEASMVGNHKSVSGPFQFGSGRLLTDLLSYSRPSHSGGTRLMFVGDRAQLPPVGESASIALDPATFASLGLQASELELSKVYRQVSESNILAVSADLRQQILSARTVRMGFAVGGDIQPIESHDVLRRVLEDIERTIVVGRTNGGVLEHNRAVRNARWGEKGLPPQVGDRLLVIQNSRRYGLLNGDFVGLISVGSVEHVHVPIRGRAPMELVFRRVEIAHGDRRESCLILENQLDMDKVDIDLMRARMIEFERRVKLPRRSREYVHALLYDERLNALAVQYGYAVTAHKAQGGEWERVIVDFSNVGRSLEDFRWVYTAVTRARTMLWTLGAPKFSEYTGLAPDSTEGEKPFVEGALLASAGIEVRSQRNIQHGKQLLVGREGIECTINRFESRRGTTWVFVRGNKELYKDVEHLVTPGPHDDNVQIEDLLSKVREVAPTGGTASLERVRPFRVTVRMSCESGGCSLDFTHDKNYKWKGPTEAPSWAQEWLRRVSRL